MADDKNKGQQDVESNTAPVLSQSLQPDESLTPALADQEAQGNSLETTGQAPEISDNGSQAPAAYAPGVAAQAGGEQPQAEGGVISVDNTIAGMEDQFSESKPLESLFPGEVPQTASDKIEAELNKAFAMDEDGAKNNILSGATAKVTQGWLPSAPGEKSQPVTWIDITPSQQLAPEQQEEFIETIKQLGIILAIEKKYDEAKLNGGDDTATPVNNSTVVHPPKRGEQEFSVELQGITPKDIWKLMQELQQRAEFVVKYASAHPEFAQELEAVAEMAVLKRIDEQMAAEAKSQENLEVQPDQNDVTSSTPAADISAQSSGTPEAQTGQSQLTDTLVAQSNDLASQPLAGTQPMPKVVGASAIPRNPAVAATRSA